MDRGNPEERRRRRSSSSGKGVPRLSSISGSSFPPCSPGARSRCNSEGSEIEV
jgi:hypothetical protein